MLIVERKVYPETPPRVEYTLTKKGWELHAVLCQLGDWVKKWETQAPQIREQTRDENTATTVPTPIPTHKPSNSRNA